MTFFSVFFLQMTAVFPPLSQVTETILLLRVKLQSMTSLTTLQCSYVLYMSVVILRSFKTRLQFN